MPYLKLLRWRSLAAVLILAAPCPGAAWAARLSVVMNDKRPGHQKVVDALMKDFGASHEIHVFKIQDYNLSDPIIRGQFLARVAAADLIIPIGDAASLLIAQELEDVKTFFISAGGLSGAYLGQSQVAGVLSYSPEETVRLAKALLPRANALGVLYTPGYEKVVVRMRAAAKAEGLSLEAYRVDSRKDVGPLIRTAVPLADVFWVVGDPVLSQDIIFSYVVQECLKLKKPLATPLPGLVAKGALFSTIPDYEKLASFATATLAPYLSGTGPSGAREDRVFPAPGESFVLLNGPLAAKWGIQPPSSLRLWPGKAP